MNEITFMSSLIREFDGIPCAKHAEQCFQGLEGRFIEVGMMLFR